MSSHSNRDDQRLQELIAGKVMGDLSKDEMQEFGELFSSSNVSELHELEVAAAALHVAIEQSAAVSMPDSLRQRIAEASVKFVANQSNSSAESNQPHPSGPTETLTISTSVEGANYSNRPQPSRWTYREAIAWFAMAASLFIAFQFWLDRDARNKEIAQEPTAAESRLTLLNKSDNLIRVDWASGKTPFETPVTGDIVWSNSNQQGFMRFVGMPPNDPKKEQYQLWIIDPERDAEPIDGGVFDISSSGEVVVPIQAKLKVLKPAAFAVTIEQPGGVVVSTQDRLPLLAQISN